MSLHEAKLRVILSAERICQMQALELINKPAPDVLWRGEARIMARRAARLWLMLVWKRVRGR